MRKRLPLPFISNIMRVLARACYNHMKYIIVVGRKRDIKYYGMLFHANSQNKYTWL